MDKSDPQYRQLWKIVDGALTDAFGEHPDYVAHVSPSRQGNIRSSIVKRVTGQVHGYLNEAAKGRSGESPAVETEAPSALRSFLTRLGTRARKLVGSLHPASTIHLPSKSRGAR